MSPSQTDVKFDVYIRSLDGVIDNINQSNPYFVLKAGDFDACSCSSWENDINDFEGISMENLTLYYGLKQLKSEPTHLLPTSSSYIHVIFTNQHNMVMNSGVFP